MFGGKGSSNTSTAPQRSKSLLDALKEEEKKIREYETKEPIKPYMDEEDEDDFKANATK